MPKTITSPVERWSGTVTLSDPLNFPQVMGFQDALESAREFGDDASVIAVNYSLLPGILPCVEQWELDGEFPASPGLDTFPATPALASAELIAWLVGEISGLFAEAEEIPKE